MRNHLLAIACCTILGAIAISCATVKPTENQHALASWIDFYYVDVIYQLGEPHYIYSDGLTGKVLAYENVLQRSNINMIGYYDESYHLEIYDVVWNQSTNRTTPSRVAQTYDILYVDKDGFVYSIQSNKSSREIRKTSENNAVIVGVISFGLLLILLLSAE